MLSSRRRSNKWSKASGGFVCRRAGNKWKSISGARKLPLPPPPPLASPPSLATSPLPEWPLLQLAFPSRPLSLPQRLAKFWLTSRRQSERPRRNATSGSANNKMQTGGAGDDQIDQSSSLVGLCCCARQQQRPTEIETPDDDQSLDCGESLRLTQQQQRQRQQTWPRANEIPSLFGSLDGLSETDELELAGLEGALGCHYPAPALALWQLVLAGAATMLARPAPAEAKQLDADEPPVLRH